MRRIERTGQFKRDDKREAKGQHRATLDAELIALVKALAGDQPLAPRYRDHALSGDGKDHRDCHLKPDRVLIYHKTDDAVCSSCAWARTASWVSDRADRTRRKA